MSHGYFYPCDLGACNRLYEKLFSLCSGMHCPAGRAVCGAGIYFSERTEIDEKQKPGTVILQFLLGQIPANFAALSAMGADLLRVFHPHRLDVL